MREKLVALEVPIKLGLAQKCLEDGKTLGFWCCKTLKVIT
jgi:hypothetical protein